MGKNIGEKIKFIRKQKNMAQYALAKKAGISQSTLSYIEKGRKTLRFETLQSICKALDTSILELLSCGEDAHPTRFFNEAPAAKRSAAAAQSRSAQPAAARTDTIERNLYLSYFGEPEPAGALSVCESEKTL